MIVQLGHGRSYTLDIADHRCHQRGYGATAARLTPDQKVGSSNLSGLIFFVFSKDGQFMM